MKPDAKTSISGVKKKDRKKPLAGKRILTTRAREQSSVFTKHLKALGADVIEFPTIEIVPPASWKKLDRAIDRLESYDWIIFTSANGVLFFWQRLKERKSGLRLPASLNVCAIGPATARQLKEKKVRVDATPKEYIAEAILKGFEKMNIRGKKILLARARAARDILPFGLKKMGAEIDVAEAYRTVKPRGGIKRLKTWLENGKIDAVTFTSSSTVNHFADLLKGKDLKSLMRGIAVACIGPVTARTARERGLRVHIQPAEYTIPGLSRAIARYFKSPPSSRKKEEGN